MTDKVRDVSTETPPLVAAPEISEVQSSDTAIQASTPPPSTRLPRKKLIRLGLLSLLIGLIACVSIGVVSRTSGTAGGGAAAPDLNGRWLLRVLDSAGQTNDSVLLIKQSGSSISGTGSAGTHTYTISGSYRVPNIVFRHNWTDSRKEARPTDFSGYLDWVNPDFAGGHSRYHMHVSGTWTQHRRLSLVTLKGRWEAAMMEPLKSESNSNWTDEIVKILQGRGPISPSDLFLRIAAVLLLAGLGLVFASVKMFGPNGLLNVSAKKKYIPSQFQAQHMKMVREFGKPLKTGGVPLGTRVEWNVLRFWQPRELNIPPESRQSQPHILVLGAGSKGKSRLLASMIAQDIGANDRAVVVVDSNGGLVDLLRGWIANHERSKEFAQRLLVIDPIQRHQAVSYNPLEYPDDDDLQNAASALVLGFKAVYTEAPGMQSQWNQQTADILRNSAVLLMANGKTLVDLPVLLSENDFRDVLLEKVERQKGDKAEYAALVEAWTRYKRMARTDQWINWIEPILNRVNPMLSNPRIRPLLTKPQSDVNLKEIISARKILFVKVPQAHLDQSANLLGSLIITGLRQAALSLSLEEKPTKRPCALYVDEFDNFVEKETFNSITSETKKFQIGFTGAAKTLQGLPEDYRNQIIINTGTLACFALAKKDGDFLGPQMFRVDGRKVKHQTLQNIFNKVNSAPTFELISDEEKLNIDRVVGQEERTFFCYRVGTVAGVFHLRSPDFKDISDKDGAKPH